MPPEHAASTPVASTRAERYAYWISHLISPPFVAAAAIALCTWALDSPAARAWSLAYLAFTVLVPTLFVIISVARGTISGIHLPHRRERFWPMLVSLTCAVLAWAALQHVDGPALLRAVAGINVVQAILFFIITLYWKISLHSAAIAGLTVLAAFLLGWFALPIGISVPIVSWARIRLRRHTPAQTIVGALLGAITVGTWLLIAGF